MVTGTKNTLPYEDDPYDLNAGIVANEAAAATGGYRTPTFSRTPYTGPGNPNMKSGPRDIYEKYGLDKSEVYRLNQNIHDAKYGRAQDPESVRRAAFRNSYIFNPVASKGSRPASGQGGHQYGDPPTGPGSGGEYPGGGGYPPPGDYPPPDGGGGGGGYPYGDPGTPPGGGEYPGPGGGGEGGADQGGLMDTLADYQKQAEEFYARANEFDPNAYQIDAPETNVFTREVGRNELSGNRLEALLDPNSQMSRRAIQSGMDFSAGRGLMNSSIAGGNAMGSWIDRAQPFALDEAATYGRTAAENMAAQNVGAQQDAQAQLQARLAEVGYNAQRDADIRGFNLGSATDLRRALLNIEGREDTQQFTSEERRAIEAFQRGERIDTQNWTDAQRRAVEAWQTGERIGTQGWQTGERIGGQGWQTGERVGAQQWSSGEREAIQAFTRGERMDTQNWTAGQREAAESFQWQRDQLSNSLSYAQIDQQDRSIWLQAWTNVQTGQSNSIAQGAAQIYANTNLTPAQQNQAIQNMMNFFNSNTPQMPPPPGQTQVPNQPYDPYNTSASQPYTPPYLPGGSGPAYGPQQPNYVFGLT